ncbi:MAG: glycosyltransferase [Spirochaetes bacterium RBG_13_68_11]|nr:MAG: glycosyltransferase [Spirochaetes bacterium RBG_13_68_11]
MKQPLTSVVIPVFNEEECLRAMHDRLTKVMRGLKEPYELLFVNDGSTDGTSSMLEELCSRDRTCRAVFFSRNFGHQAAITAGMREARGRAIVVIDADLQDPPELIPEMILRWKGGAEVVYGRRIRRNAENPFKRFTASLFYRFLNMLTDVPLPKDIGDFRLIDRKVCDCLNGLGEKHRYVRGLVGWLGFQKAVVDYVREPRWAGTTKYPMKKMVSFAVDAITSFSNRPLRVAGYLGALISLGGFLYLFVILVRKMLGVGMVEGWTSLMSLIVGFSGLIILFLGLLGEYLGRIFDEVKGRPLYVISRTLGGSAGDQQGRKTHARER